MGMNHFAAEVLGKAEQRLLTFYRSAEFQAEAEEKEEVAPSLLQLLARAHTKGGGTPPPPPPEEFSRYAGKGGPVLRLISKLQGTLAREASEAKTLERQMQDDYDIFVRDARGQRGKDPGAPDAGRLRHLCEG